jgi:hypothetical protein
MINTEEKLGGLKGIFEARIYRAGKLVEEARDGNLIVDGARFQMARLLAGEFTGRNIAKIAFGTSGIAADPADTVIASQFVKPLAGFSYPENGQARFDWELTVAENNGMAILEFGLLTADGTLFSRKTRTNPIYKASDISIEGRWTIIFLG